MAALIGGGAYSSKYGTLVLAVLRHSAENRTDDVTVVTYFIFDFLSAVEFKNCIQILLEFPQPATEIKADHVQPRGFHVIAATA